jgi:hypothetical protein
MNYVNGIITTIFATPWIQVVILCLLSGYIVRMLPFIPNRLIVLVTTLIGGIVLPYLTPRGAVSPDVPHPMFSLVIIGLAMGFSVWLFHKLIGKRIEDKFPSFKGFLDQFDNEEPKPAPVEPPKP